MKLVLSPMDTHRLLTTAEGRGLLEIGGDMMLALIITDEQVERFLALAVRDPDAVALLRGWSLAHAAGDVQARRLALWLLELSALVAEGDAFPRMQESWSAALLAELEANPPRLPDDAIDALEFSTRFFLSEVS